MAVAGALRYSSIIERRFTPNHSNLFDQEIIMNIAKNMEAIFVAILVLAGVTSYATAAVPKFHAALRPAAIVAVAGTSTKAIPTVVIAAKRLTAEQKAAL
jgi:D-arabinose 1-dehydrogenase-like Zn-dependent alcohol dehydrogenase